MSPSNEVVVGAAIIRAGRILLVQQRKPSALGLWTHPGGHVEAAETLEQALARELREEVGLTPTSATHLHTDCIGTKFEHHAFYVAATDYIILGQDELLGFGWFTFKQLQTMRPILRAAFILDTARAAFELSHQTEPSSK